MKLKDFKFSIFLLVVVSCDNIFVKDDLTIIKDEIETELFINMNNPDSYEFVDFQVFDTVLVKDVYQHEIEIINNEIGANDANRIAAPTTDRRVIERDLDSLRNVFEVYATGRELDLINEVISLFSDNGEWLPMIIELERYIKNSNLQSYRYRNELPIIERTRRNGIRFETGNRLADYYQNRINELVEKKKHIHDFVDINNEKMTEIAFLRTLFSFREQNVFGGIQLIRQIYEVRFINDEIELLWASQKFDSSDFSNYQLSEIPYGDGINVLKAELSNIRN